MDVIVRDNKLQIDGRTFRCAIGPAGISEHKKEGDGATPAGRFPLRQIFYRADRIPVPICQLPVHAMQPSDGWCDEPSDPKYNQLVKLPYAGKHEGLWRDDALYDLLIVVGYNDAPIVVAAGSAIFIHVARESYSPTQGCVALSLSDLQFVVEHLSKDSAVVISNGTKQA